jgi:hypothetical protein
MLTSNCEEQMHRKVQMQTQRITKCTFLLRFNDSLVNIPTQNPVTLEGHILLKVHILGWHIHT